jgi:hypothetical protein
MQRLNISRILRQSNPDNKMRSIFKTLLLALIFLSVLSSAIAQDMDQRYYELNGLSSFSLGHEFAFVDIDIAMME